MQNESKRNICNDLYFFSICYCFCYRYNIINHKKNVLLSGFFYFIIRFQIIFKLQFAQRKYKYKYNL